jgi:hypothetical protein
VADLSGIFSSPWLIVGALLFFFFVILIVIVLAVSCAH